MGTAFLYGNGGGGGSGGSELTIVGGTTRPAKVTQNMIWIDTDTDITGYILSATEPESPVEGMAWIVIGNTGIKAASPVGGDWITVYPLEAKQYVDGVWVDKTAKSYQNGEWVGWITELYYLGDECTDLTGGWVTYTAASTNPGGNVTVTKYPSCMDLSLTAFWRGGYLYTRNKIYVNDKTKLVCEFTEGQSGYQLYIALFNELTDSVGSIITAAKVSLIGKTGKEILDISSITGAYYIGFGIAADGGTNQQQKTAKLTGITKVYFE